MEVKLNNISKSYEDATSKLTVIDNLEFTFPSGSKTAIIGRSGIGKSTLLNLIAGLDFATSGHVSYDKVDFSGMKDEAQALYRARNIGFVFQFHYLLPEFSALENVAMPLVIGGMDWAQANKQASDLLEKVGLKSRLNNRPGALSGGEQQRVSLARALVNNPKVLLADEPTGNLDLKSAKLVQELMLDLTSELKTTVIIMTHSEELAKQMEQIFEMNEGGRLVKC